MRVIGIDDWARHLGDTRDPIVVELARHWPVDRLADRDVTTVRRGVTGRRDVGIVAPDGAGAHVEGIWAALLPAVEAADRRHLIGGLRDALDRSVVRMGVRCALRRKQFHS